MDNNIGLKYHKLTILEFIERKNNHNFYKCICDCGTEFKTTLNNIRTGNTKSCGCLRSDKIRKLTKTHGLSSTAEYNAYRTMINRCEDKNHIQYSNYGGRGITVCDRWKKSFEDFIEDMRLRPKIKYQLDRIDNNGPYSKENCRWVTPKQNARNGTIVKFYEYENNHFTLNELCAKFNMNYNCVRKRLIRGWTLEKALKTPSENKNSIPETNKDKFL